MLTASHWLTDLGLSDLGKVDPIVLGILFFLTALSVLTWFLIAYKAVEFAWAKRVNGKYAQRFWHSPRLSLLHEDDSARSTLSPLARLTTSGVTAVKQYRDIEGDPAAVTGNLAEALTRSLRQSIQDQMTHFERGLGILATIGNTAPFVGLFGTVVGIMSALKGIAEIGSADLSVVAGPIGEALIATAAGIACAIPAVVGYNSYVRRLKVLGNTLDSFAYDLLSRLSAEHARQGVSVKNMQRAD